MEMELKVKVCTVGMSVPRGEEKRREPARSSEKREGKRREGKMSYM